MFDWLKRLGKPPAVPLTGAPPVRRQKTYSAHSGYVYQYYYEGHRRAGKSTEYVFDVSADRRTSFPVSVFVDDGAVAPWEQQHQRELSGTERYAIAKMGLFQAFDERPAPSAMRQRVLITRDAAEQILATLDL